MALEGQYSRQENTAQAHSAHKRCLQHPRKIKVTDVDLEWTPGRLEIRQTVIFCKCAVAQSAASVSEVKVSENYRDFCH
jgi:hypothetical protein